MRPGGKDEEVGGNGSVDRSQRPFSPLGGTSMAARPGRPPEKFLCCPAVVQHAGGVTKPFGVNGPKELRSPPPTRPVLAVRRDSIQVAEQLCRLAYSLSADHGGGGDVGLRRALFDLSIGQTGRGKGRSASLVVISQALGQIGENQRERPAVGARFDEMASGRTGISATFEPAGGGKMGALAERGVFELEPRPQDVGEQPVVTVLTPLRAQLHHKEIAASQRIEEFSRVVPTADGTTDICRQVFQD